MHYECRGVILGAAGGAMAPPDFGRSVNPISTRGTDYANLITNGTPGFSDLPTALSYYAYLGAHICYLSFFKAVFSFNVPTLCFMIRIEVFVFLL